MKDVRVQGEVAHLGLGDDEAGLIASLIELELDAQPSGGARVADQLDEGLEGTERTLAPVLRGRRAGARPCSTCSCRVGKCETWMQRCFVV